MGIKNNWFKTDTRTGPFIYVNLQLADKPLKFLTTLTSFGTPIDITAAELQIEHYYPADVYTESLLHA